MQLLSDDDAFPILRYKTSYVLTSYRVVGTKGQRPAAIGISTEATNNECPRLG
jgi:hypothetical protein